MRATAFQRRVLAQPLLSWPRVDVLGFLDQVRSDVDFEQISFRQQLNVIEQLEGFHRDLREGLVASVAIVDVGRDPASKFDSTRAVGSTRTLRTNCSHLWVLPSPELIPAFGPKGRLLNRQEKCKVAGIRPSSLADLDAEALDTAIGNTIPVALVGVVLFPVFRAWIKAVCEEDPQTDETIDEKQSDSEEDPVALAIDTTEEDVAYRHTDTGIGKR
jgi:hypothetical protein